MSSSTYSDWALIKARGDFGEWHLKQIITEAKAFEATITLACHDHSASLKEPFKAFMILGYFRYREVMTVTGEGKDAEAAVKHIVGMVEEWHN